jgi:hypothetical protein
MQHYQRLHVLIEPGHHAALLAASKRSGISMGKLLDIGIADLLARIEREGAVTVPLQPLAGGKLSIIPPLEQGAVLPAVSAPGAAAGGSSPSSSAPAAPSKE